MTGDKVCPLLTIPRATSGELTPQPARCIGERCAWWVAPCPGDRQSGCALAVLAVELADPPAVNDLTGELSELAGAAKEIARHQ